MNGKAANRAPHPTFNQAGLLVTIAILLGIVAGQAGAMLTVVSGGGVAAALKAGAVAFSGAVTLVIAIMYAIRRL